MKKDEKYYGGKIHKILNLTLERKLTWKEYKRVIENIQNLLVASRKNSENVVEQIVQLVRKFK